MQKNRLGNFPTRFIIEPKKALTPLIGIRAIFLEKFRQKIGL